MLSVCAAEHLRFNKVKWCGVVDRSTASYYYYSVMNDNPKSRKGGQENGNRIRSKRMY